MNCSLSVADSVRCINVKILIMQVLKWLQNLILGLGFNLNQDGIIQKEP